MAQFRVGEKEVILPLGDVVGIFIAEGKAEAHRIALAVNHVEAREFRLFAAVQSERGLGKRCTWGHKP